MTGTSLTGNDTIFAVASGIGRSAVAVIRLSGSGAGAALMALLTGPLPPPRRASLRRLIDPASGGILDQALILWLPGPGTFTGEDQAELQLHGSAAVRAAVLRVLSGLPGCRAAEPGEFTRRAFRNGKLDLTAVEGLADLIDAETEAQRRQAVRQLEGRLAAEVAVWRERLIEAMAACEADLDFSDESDVPSDVAASATGIAASIRTDIAAALTSAARGERVREGFQVVIAGPPNAGKSTLLNALARREVAIVSPIPGTTRDAIEVRCDLGGLPVTFVDTAGLRGSDDPIEREGMARTRERMERADLVLWLEPCGASAAKNAMLHPLPPYAEGVATDGNPIFRHAEERPEGSRLEARTTVVRPSRRAFGAPQDDEGGSFQPGNQEDDRQAEIAVSSLVITTKTDLGPSAPGSDLAVSAKTGEGMSELLARVEKHAAETMVSGADAVLTRERHRSILVDVLACLDRAAAAGGEGAIELLAEDLRLALRHLGRLTGAVDVEEVLDRIFASFCIGK